ncbi:hypothetical protein ACLB1N_21535 [Escherichia coli]
MTQRWQTVALGMPRLWSAASVWRGNAQDLLCNLAIISYINETDEIHV